MGCGQSHAKVSSESSTVVQSSSHTKVTSQHSDPQKNSSSFCATKQPEDFISDGQGKQQADSQNLGGDNRKAVNTKADDSRPDKEHLTIKFLPDVFDTAQRTESLTPDYSPGEKTHIPAKDIAQEAVFTEKLPQLKATKPKPKIIVTKASERAINNDFGSKKYIKVTKEQAFIESHQSNIQEEKTQTQISHFQLSKKVQAQTFIETSEKTPKNQVNQNTQPEKADSSSVSVSNVSSDSSSGSSRKLNKMLRLKQEIYRRAKTDQTFVSSYSRGKQAPTPQTRDRGYKDLLVKELEEKKRRLDILIEMSSKNPSEFNRLVKKEWGNVRMKTHEDQSQSSLRRVQSNNVHDSLLDQGELHSLGQFGQRYSLAADSLLNNVKRNFNYGTSSSKQSHRTNSVFQVTQQKEQPITNAYESQFAKSKNINFPSVQSNGLRKSLGGITDAPSISRDVVLQETDMQIWGKTSSLECSQLPMFERSSDNFSVINQDNPGVSKKQQTPPPQKGSQIQLLELNKIVKSVKFDQSIIKEQSVSKIEDARRKKSSVEKRRVSQIPKNSISTFENLEIDPFSKEQAENQSSLKKHVTLNLEGTHLDSSIQSPKIGIVFPKKQRSVSSGSNLSDFVIKSGKVTNSQKRQNLRGFYFGQTSGSIKGKNEMVSPGARLPDKTFTKSNTMHRYSTQKVNLNMSYIDPKQMVKMKKILKRASVGINASFSQIRTMTLSPQNSQKRKCFQEKNDELGEDDMANILGKIGEENSDSAKQSHSTLGLNLIKQVQQARESAEVLPPEVALEPDAHSNDQSKIQEKKDVPEDAKSESLSSISSHDPSVKVSKTKVSVIEGTMGQLSSVQKYLTQPSVNKTDEKSSSATLNMLGQEVQKQSQDQIHQTVPVKDLTPNPAAPTQPKMSPSDAQKTQPKNFQLISELVDLKALKKLENTVTASQKHVHVKDKPKIDPTRDPKRKQSQENVVSDQTKLQDTNHPNHTRDKPKQITSVDRLVFAQENQPQEPVVVKEQEVSSPKHFSQIQSPLSISTAKNFIPQQKKGILITNSKKHILTDGSTPKHRQTLNVYSGSNTPSQFRKNFTINSSQHSTNEIQAGLRHSRNSIQDLNQAQELAYLNQLQLMQFYNQNGMYFQPQMHMPSPIYGPGPAYFNPIIQQSPILNPNYFMSPQIGHQAFQSGNPVRQRMRLHSEFVNSSQNQPWSTQNMQESLHTLSPKKSSTLERNFNPNQGNAASKINSGRKKSSQSPQGPRVQKNGISNPNTGEQSQLSPSKTAVFFEPQNNSHFESSRVRLSQFDTFMKTDVGEKSLPVNQVLDVSLSPGQNLMVRPAQNNQNPQTRGQFQVF